MFIAENGSAEPTLTDAALCPNYSNAQEADFANSGAQPVSNLKKPFFMQCHSGSPAARNPS